jgi:hypothetical protein
MGNAYLVMEGKMACYCIKGEIDKQVDPEQLSQKK